MVRARTWLQGVAIAAASVNAVLHLVLLGTGALAGPLGWVMLFGALLCLPCIPSLVVGRDLRGPWLLLAGMNALMLVSHALVMAVGAGPHAHHAMHAGAAGALLVSTASSLVEAVVAVVILRGLRTRSVASG